MAEPEGLVWVIPDDYPFVILAAVLLCIECFLFTFAVAQARGRIFTREWLTDNFEEEHI